MKLDSGPELYIKLAFSFILRYLIQRQNFEFNSFMTEKGSEREREQVCLRYDDMMNIIRYKIYICFN